MRFGVAFLSMALTLMAADAEFIFVNAPFRSAHASTVVELRNGDVLAAWFGGSDEGKPDVAIWGARRTAAGWSKPFELAREPKIAAYNPVLFYTKDGTLWLYYKFGPHPTSWTAARRSSTDDGRTWSPVEYLPAGIYGPVRARPLLLDDGTVVSGTSVESFRAWACWIERSTDNGRTWTKAGPVTVAPDAAQRTVPITSRWDPPAGIIQPSIVPLGGDRLRLYARPTERIGRICVADSNDGGRTWTEARPIDVPNPDSGFDAMALGDGRIVLVYNHSDRDRTPLNLAVSTDGTHFRMFRVLEDRPGEYSYPTLAPAANGDLHITYTWKRKKIRYIRIAADEIPR